MVIAADGNAIAWYQNTIGYGENTTQENSKYIIYMVCIMNSEGKEVCCIVQSRKIQLEFCNFYASNLECA